MATLRHYLQRGHLILGFLCKLLAAAGAGDPQSALASGDSDPGLAAGALEIAVGLPALDPGEELEKLLILRVPLGHVPGEGTKDRPNERDVGQGTEQRDPGDGAHQIEDHAKDQKEPAELIYAVAACHKPANGITEALHHDHYHLSQSHCIYHTPPKRNAQWARGNVH